MKTGTVLATSKITRIKTQLIVTFPVLAVTLPTSEELQPLIKYFETFLSITVLSFQHKWKRHYIIFCTNSRYELPHELPNNLKI